MPRVLRASMVALGATRRIRECPRQKGMVGGSHRCSRCMREPAKTANCCAENVVDSMGHPMSMPCISSR